MSGPFSGRRPALAVVASRSGGGRNSARRRGGRSSSTQSPSDPLLAPRKTQEISSVLPMTFPTPPRFLIIAQGGNHEERHTHPHQPSIPLLILVGLASPPRQSRRASTRGRPAGRQGETFGRSHRPDGLGHGVCRHGARRRFQEQRSAEALGSRQHRPDQYSAWFTGHRSFGSGRPLRRGHGTGGVFKSTNGAGSWTAINAGLADTDVNALAIDPMTPATLYAGTGRGVFKSINGGGSWNGVNAGLTDFVWMPWPSILRRRPRSTLRAKVATRAPTAERVGR